MEHTPFPHGINPGQAPSCLHHTVMRDYGRQAIWGSSFSLNTLVN